MELRILKYFLTITCALWAWQFASAQPKVSSDATHASRPVRIIKENECKVVISGGEFSLGDRVFFFRKRNFVMLDITVQIIKKMEKNRWVGKILDEGVACSVFVGAEMSESKTLIAQAVDQWFIGLFGARVQQSRGQFSIVRPNDKIEFPLITLARGSLEFFPLAKSNFGSLSQGVSFGLSGEWGANMGDGFKSEDGTTHTGKLWSVNAYGGLQTFVLGTTFPTKFILGYSLTKLSFKDESTGSFGRSVLRDFDCGGGTVGLAQSFRFGRSYSLVFGGEAMVGVSCSTNEVSDREALALEVAQGVILGVGGDPTPSADMTSKNDLKSPLRISATGHVDAAISGGFGARLGIRWSQFEAKLARDNGTRQVSYSEYGIELLLRAQL